MMFSYIKRLGEHVGAEVTVRGWLYNKRSSGKIRFLVVRDGTGLVQCVLAKGDVSDEVFDRHDKLNQESSLQVTGLVRADTRAPGGYELTVTGLEIVQVAEEYPITPKEHGVDYLMNLRHLWLRSSRQHAIMRVRNEVIMAIRQYFYERDYILIDTPILTGSVGESGQTLFATEYFDLGNAYLAQTGQLYAEAGAMAFGKVYCFGPTFRAEKSKTRRHLTEFWMMEPEVAFNDNNDNMDLQEDMICYIVAWVLNKSRADLQVLERDSAKLEQVKKPFPRVSYDEAVEKLRASGESDIKYGDDFGGDDETVLTNMYDRPILVYNYPRKVKAFYMKQHPERADLVLCNDMLAPEGYGEIIGGSQREEDPEKLIARIKEENLPLDAYKWYLDLRRFGSVPHSGFGLGLERTVAWICGIHHIRETIPFARTIGRIYP
jgi:asparaginyl-tRNA synthetase